MKILRQIYLFRESHLPEKGWLQACYECETITSKTINYKSISKNKKTYKFIIHICNSCKESLKADAEKNTKFINRCDKFIDEYLITS